VGGGPQRETEIGENTAMLRSLQIVNFKAWSDTGPINMAPITLFFGSNSSGKSSIGQFLMMLKQTVENSDRKAVFYPGGKNSAVQLGSYQEMVFHRDPKNRIEFRYEWDTPSLKIRDPLSARVHSGATLRFHAKAGINERDQHQHSIEVDCFRYELLPEPGKEAVLSMRMTRHPDQASRYDVEAEHYVLVRKQGRAWSPKEPVRFYGFPDEVVAYHQNADFAQELNLRQEQLFRSIQYLGPLRTKAERLYSWARTEPESVGYSGENTIAAILASRHRNIGLGYRRPTKPFEEIIASKLQQMGLIEGFKVKPISEHRQEYEVKVRVKGFPDEVDLPDVGFGVSQVLPVLVECFYAPPRSIIIMEQPEIHLHPAAQAILADVMIDVINSRENGINRDVQLIIETHSEHFLRRLQRRIAEDAVASDKISAYFANVSVFPPKLETLQIDMFGNIKNWPENFFGDELEDVTEQSKAAMKKRLNSTESGATGPE
jgi:predicted ATPase